MASFATSSSANSTSATSLLNNLMDEITNIFENNSVMINGETIASISRTQLINMINNAVEIGKNIHLNFRSQYRVFDNPFSQNEKLKCVGVNNFNIHRFIMKHSSSSNTMNEFLNNINIFCIKGGGLEITNITKDMLMWILMVAVELGKDTQWTYELKAKYNLL